jgi:hypothetical protein
MANNIFKCMNGLTSNPKKKGREYGRRCKVKGRRQDAQTLNPKP